MAGTLLVNAMRRVQALRVRLVGDVVRRAFEYWCNAEQDLSECVESAFRRIAMNR
jgi:hypothetical protein